MRRNSLTRSSVNLMALSF